MTQPHRHRPRASLLAVVPTPVLTLVAALVVALGGQVVTAPAAQAAGYQYWGYWQLSGGAWSFSQKGPAQTDPADGSVEGWRWAAADESGRPPRVVPAFDAVCGGAAAESGKKRVAVVIDFGRPADGDGTTAPPEPTAACALVPTAATGAEVLAAVATVRIGDGGLVCGVDGYPASGCGGQVATLSDAQKAADTPVTLGPTVTPQSTQPSGASSGATPGAAPTAAQSASTVAAGTTTTATTGSGVPVVVWVGMVILLLGLAALAWSAYRRRGTTV